MTRTPRPARYTRMTRRSIPMAFVALLTIPFTVAGAAAAPTIRSAATVRAIPVAAAPLAALGPVTGSSCTPSCALYAVSGTMPATALPGAPAAGVPVWGYNTASTAVTAPGGPTLIVNQGDAVSIVLHNVNIPSATSLMIAGQPVIPDTTGVTAGNTTTYSFPAVTLQPGTYLYEAGLTADGPRQAAMGLYGALVVRPAGAPAQAYPKATTAFTDEAVLVLSEIDPAFNTAPATYDIGSYTPTFWLINGKAYPNTDSITTAAGNTLLLRYVNAGLRHHSMSLIGLHQTILAKDAKPLTNQQRVVAETIPTGATLDTLVTMPATATANAKFALFDAAMHLDNAGVTTGAAPSDMITFGGMLTFVTASGVTAPTGPVTSNVNLSPTPTNGTVPVTLTATVAATADQAEYFVDTIGANGSGCAITGSVTNVNVTIPVTGATAPCADLTTLASATHTFYVHGHDTNGWGAVASGVLNLDKTGPTIGNMSVTPNDTNGTAPVQVQATGSDATTGGQNVTAAEYTIDAGSATAFTVTAATDVSLNATIPAVTVNALADGAHLIAVRAQDSLGNWGASKPVTLTVDKSGPATNLVSTTPNPTNGLSGVQVTTGGAFYQRIDATVTDPTAGGVRSNIVAAEYFIDTVGVSGAGGAMIPTDGAYNSPSEPVYGAAELYAIQALPAGSHVIYVHGKDAAGNWGPPATTTLIVDKTPPTFSAITLTPPTILAGTPTVNLTVNTPVDPAPGPQTGVVGGEYWFGTAVIPAGTGTAFTGLTNVPVATGSLTAGTYTVSVRIRDAAGNWSTGTSGVRTATLTVTLRRPTVSVGFAGAVRGGNGTQTQRTTTVTITLANPNPVPVTGVSLTDNLPQPAAGTFTVVSSTTTCAGATSTANTNRRLVLSGGSIPANSTCTVTATVRISAGATAGPYTLTNTIAAGAVTSGNAGTNAAAASATLTVNP